MTSLNRILGGMTESIADLNLFNLDPGATLFNSAPDSD